MSSRPEMTSIEKTLPSSWYTEDSVFALEREHIFFKEWICIGREEQWPKAGDNSVLDILGESILIVRSKSGALNGFYNVCVHRGARMCPHKNNPKDEALPIKGGVVGSRLILCPYHAWSYDLDGKLVSAPHMDGVEDFDKSDYSLHPVAVRTAGGFVFINLTPDTAPDFAPHVKSITATFKRYPLADLRIARTISYDIDANWKVICENYNECYHCGPVHPELCQVVPAFKDAGGSGLDWDRGVPHKEGADTFTFKGTTTRRAFPGLNADEQIRHKGDLIYPNMFLSLAKDHVAVFIFMPTSAGRTRLDCHFLFEPYEMDKPDFDGSDAIDFWDIVNQQDWAICERVQDGMRARVHDHGIFSPMEDWNLDIRTYVTERIGAFVPEEK